MKMNTEEISTGEMNTQELITIIESSTPWGYAPV